jgi:hypothetical protein
LLHCVNFGHLSAGNFALQGAAQERYSSAMTDEKDLETLAKRYLDVWESQLSGMAADSELAAQLGRVFAATNSALLASLKAPIQAAGAFNAAQQSGTTESRSDPSSGTTTATSSSRHGGLDLGEFADRLASLERRVAEVEGFIQRVIERSRKPD